MNTTTQIRADKYIDIHSHLLFGVDDGPKTIEEAEKLLKQAKLIGVEEIVLTPHQKIDSDAYRKIKELNYTELCKLASCYGIKLHLATEGVLSVNLKELIDEKIVSPFPGTKHVLVELKRNMYLEQEQITELFEKIINEGYIPVLAHPEVYPRHLMDENLIKVWHDLGVLIQLDAENLIKGKSNRKVFKYALKLLDRGLVSFIASDAHNLNRDYYNLEKSRDTLSKLYLNEDLNDLYYLNPKRLLGDKNVI